MDRQPTRKILYSAGRFLPPKGKASHSAGWSGCRTLLGGLLLFACWQGPVYGQDSTQGRLSIKKVAAGFYHSFFVVEPKMTDTVYFLRSEAGFQPYAGKLIRNVYVRRLPFGVSVLDTTRRIYSTMARLANDLQTGTRDFIIKQLLFVHPGERVDPYTLADNERYLRDLDFIKDTRIYLRQTSYPDSVDLFVVVRDVFSIGVSSDASGISRFNGSLYDANLMGRAQRLQYTLLYDHSRHPRLGSELLYRKYSLFGSFVNLEAAYTTINRGISLGTENETAAYLKLDRPLYTANARFAGGLQLSVNQSANRFQKPDSLFLDYRYVLEDAWAGYNAGARKANFSGDNRRRNFTGIRFFRQRFSREPSLKAFDPRYADKTYLLLQSSWYRINFYQTNYIYSFGKTEDLPVGFNDKFIAGYTRVDSLKRLYLGWEYRGLRLDKKGNYYDYILSIGTHYHQKLFDDNTLFFHLSWFSRLFSFPHYKLRQFTDFSYAGINQLKASEQLRIDNGFGLDGFTTDSILGVQRISLGSETALFTRWTMLGFKLGFFGFGRASLITPRGKTFGRGDLYGALGGGIRARNENLIFGTIECRFTWYPRTLDDMNNVTITVTGNLRLKFSGSFVQAPWMAEIE